MKRESVKVPDLGGASEVEVIEIAVVDGATVAAEQTLITLESDKASMEVPSPLAGTVRGIGVKVGDRVRAGDEILVIEIAGEAAAETAAPVAPAATAAAACRCSCSCSRCAGETSCRGRDRAPAAALLRLRRLRRSCRPCSRRATREPR